MPAEEEPLPIYEEIKDRLPKPFWTGHDDAIACYDFTWKLAFENYCSEKCYPGLAKRDFVGWSGLFAISIMLEYVFGIRPYAAEKKIVWYVNRTEKHGVKQYPLGTVDVDIECAARSNADEEPVITVKASELVTVEVHWNGKIKTIITK